jgi:transcription elongation factor Elf1
VLEEYFDCPYCWQTQLKMVDPSIENQNFIEDCEVCCNPIDFHIRVENNEVVLFNFEKIDQ